VMMHFFQQGGEFYSANFRKDLTKITAPTLIVHGEEDPIFPIALADEMLECLSAPRKTLMRATVGPPDARLVRIPNCGHLSEQDAPDVIMDAVIDFFRLQ